MTQLKGNILLVEDNIDNQELIAFYIKKLGPTVTIVENGRLAVDLAMVNSFDIIFMDMQMPVMGGLEATRELRARGYSGTIVALTANTMVKEMKSCFQAGYDHFLGKPIEKDKFYKLLRELLAVSNDANKNEAAQKYASTVHNEDSDLISLVENYVERLPSIVSEISYACTEGDINKLKSKVHDLKSNGSSFGFPVLTELANHIETEISDQNRDSISALVESLKISTQKIKSELDKSRETQPFKNKSA